MFAVHQISATTFRRIGLGLAIAALSVTSFAPPLSASAHELSRESVVMALGQQGDMPPIPAPNTPLGVATKADIRVVARGKTQVGKTTKYTFVIRNLGPNASGNFNAYKEAQLQSASDFMLTDNGYFPLSLASGQEKIVTVSCTPPVGFSCTQATVLSVNNGTDPDNNNNIATLN
jgi:hypothetical protein